MLATKRSAGIALEMKPTNPLRASEGIHPGFETQDRRHHKSKIGMSSKNL